MLYTCYFDVVVVVGGCGGVIVCVVVVVAVVVKMTIWKTGLWLNMLYSQNKAIISVICLKPNTRDH